MHRSIAELSAADAEAEPYRLYLIAMGWTNIRWAYRPPVMYTIHCWDASGEIDGRTYEVCDPVSPEEALLSLKRQRDRGLHGE